MAPWMEIGVVKISDADDPFLNLLRRSLEDYPDGNDDVRDAALLSMKSMPEVLVVPDTQDGEALPQVQRQLNKQKKSNPFNALGG